MRRARVEVWGAVDCLAAADAVEVARLNDGKHIVFQAQPVFEMAGEAMAVRYLRDGELYSQVNVQVGGEPNPSVAVLPKAVFEVGESLEFAFAPAAAEWERPDVGQLVASAGNGSVSFDLEIFDPKTGERQVHHCTGQVQ